MDWGHKNKFQQWSGGDTVDLVKTKTKAMKSKGDNTYWKVKGFVKNMKERTIVMAFRPVVTAKKET